MAEADALPSVRGAPTALGFCEGSKTSERRPLTALAALRRRAGRRRHWRRTRSHAGAALAHLLEAIFGVVLQALELHLQHLVVVLQLFDGAGELAQRALDAVDARGIVAAAEALRTPRRLRLLRLRLLLRLLLLALAAEQVVEQPGRTVLRGCCAAGEQHG